VTTPLRRSTPAGSTSLAVTLAIACAVALLAGTARAHGVGQMLIGSTADGGGALEADYVAGGVTAVTFVAEIAGTSVYTADQPSLDALAADDVAAGRYVLDDGTEVSVTVTALEPGKTAMKVNGTVLDAVGASAVIATFSAAEPAAFHRHPEWQLLLALPAGTYGSGTIAFKLTTTSQHYAESASYTLTLSNGQVAPFVFDAAAYDKNAIACQKTIGKAVRTFVDAEQQQLGKCLDKVQVVKAIEAAIGDSRKAAKAAAATCGNAMVAKIDAARRKAVDAIRAKCAAVGLGAEAVAAHVSFASCESEKLIAASYADARGLLGDYVAGGRPASTSFPCL
jgi:hypothetical protein